MCLRELLKGSSVRLSRKQCTIGTALNSKIVKIEAKVLLKKERFIMVWRETFSYLASNYTFY